MTITAANKKHQKAVNKAAKWMEQYNKLNDIRNESDGNVTSREFAKIERKCADAFDKYQDSISSLPKREVERIEKILW